MVNPKRARKTAIGIALAVAIFFTGWGLLQAQESLSIRGVQVLNTDQNRICQHVYENGGYKLAWQSTPLEGKPCVRLGDIDNNGQPEVVAGVYYFSRAEEKIVGRKRTTTYYYNFRVHVFTNGAALNGTPEWSTVELGEIPNGTLLDLWVGDVDNDTQNELAMIRNNLLEVYHVTRAEGEDAVITHECLKAYASSLYSIDVGEADNIGGNEILVATPGQPYIWKCTNGSWAEFRADAVPTQYYGPGMTSIATPYLRIRNADNVPGNEIIATGNNGRLMVWKYDENIGSYKWNPPSPYFNSPLAMGIDSGNIDGDALNTNEVAINARGLKREPARIIILAFENGVWVIKNTYATFSETPGDLRVWDLDSDGTAEVIPISKYLTPEMWILDLDLRGVFFQAYTAPGDPQYQKIEIR